MCLHTLHLAHWDQLLRQCFYMKTKRNKKQPYFWVPSQVCGFKGSDMCCFLLWIFYHMPLRCFLSYVVLTGISELLKGTLNKQKTLLPCFHLASLSDVQWVSAACVVFRFSGWLLYLRKSCSLSHGSLSCTFVTAVDLSLLCPHGFSLWMLSAMLQSKERKL